MEVECGRFILAKKNPFFVVFHINKKCVSLLIKLYKKQRQNYGCYVQWKKSILLKCREFKYGKRTCVITSPAFSFFAGMVGIGIVIFYWHLEDFQFGDIDNILSDLITAEIRLHRFWYFQNVRPTE